MIAIPDLARLRDALQRLELAETQRSALAAQASKLAEDVRALLSREPGADHSSPWLRTGDLRASIASDSSTDQAFVGSKSAVAVYQELGTAAVPPRPFLAPAAAAGGEDAASEIGQTLVAAIRDSLR